MPTQVERNDAVLEEKILQLILPLLCLTPKTMDKDESPPRTLGRDVYRR